MEEILWTCLIYRSWKFNYKVDSDKLGVEVSSVIWAAGCVWVLPGGREKLRYAGISQKKISKLGC